jgi:hypothetical protein
VKTTARPRRRSSRAHSLRRSSRSVSNRLFAMHSDRLVTWTDTFTGDTSPTLGDPASTVRAEGPAPTSSHSHSTHSTAGVTSTDGSSGGSRNNDAPTGSSTDAADGDPFASLPGLPALPALPSLPSLPEPTDTDGTGDENADADSRMQALLGLRGPDLFFPPAPSSAPRKKGAGPGPAPRRPGQGWGIAGYDDLRDDELETWCCEFITGVV